MAEDDPTGSAWGEDRERGSRRKKVYGYLKAANDLRQSYQSQWAQSRNQGDELEAGFSATDIEIVRSGDEEMILFPSYARQHNMPPGTTVEKPGARDDIADRESAEDVDYWREQWAAYEDESALVEIDVRGWIYTPHKGRITRKNRMLIAVARRLSGIPAPPSPSSPPHSRESSRHSIHREKRGELTNRHEEEEAFRKAQSIVQRGEGEAEAAWRGKYSKDPSRGADCESLYSTRSTSPSGEQIPGRFPKPRIDPLLALDGEDTGYQSSSSSKGALPNAPTNPSKEDLSGANAHLMARLKPFMHLPLAGAPITAFFFNGQKSQSRSINTDDSGHFVLRAALDFVPTSLRVLASEKLSVTEEITITKPRGVSLISDIDDTIKHSAVASGAKEIFNNTFVRELGELTIEGVKEWYSKLSAMGVKLHYVSNSPWQLYPLLQSYFALAGLPSGSFHLKQYSGMLQGIFEPAAERKKGSLERILKDFPERQFVLVGDSGEADLEVYTEVVAANPGRVLGVFIRDVTSTTPAERKASSDQSTGYSRGWLHRSAWEHSDAPEDRPTPPPRRPGTTAKAEPVHHPPQEDLIDLNEEQHPNQWSSPQEPRRTEQRQHNPTYSPPPARPPKPLALRSASNTQSRSNNHERPTPTASDQDKSPSQQKGSPTHREIPHPPPKPLRPSSSIDMAKPTRAPMSSPRQHQTYQQPRSEEEEGYASSAHRRIISAYNTLPSARALWSGGSTSSLNSLNSPSSPSSSYPPTNNNIFPNPIPSSSAPLPAIDDNNNNINKKEEVWRRRWARAEDFMRREGVLLRNWRVGADVMDDCIRLCERALEAVESERGKEDKEGK